MVREVTLTVQSVLRRAHLPSPSPPPAATQGPPGTLGAVLDPRLVPSGYNRPQPGVWTCMAPLSWDQKQDPPLTKS